MNTRQTFLAAGCMALNLTLAKVAALLSLPVYLDSVGTIISVALLPWYLSITIALGTSFIGAIVINPYWAAYCGTQLTIALVAIVCYRAGMLKTWWQSLLSGMIIAISAVIVSAPVTVLLFGGVTLSGTTAINAVLLASGKNIWQSVIGGAIFVESIDKPSAALLAWLVVKRLPAELTGKFSK